MMNFGKIHSFENLANCSTGDTIEFSERPLCFIKKVSRLAATSNEWPQS